MISIEHKGDFKNTIRFLDILKKDKNIESILSKYGEKGVKALADNTPVDSGKTASMWGYEIHKSKKTYSIVWTNDNIKDNIPIAVLIQYGHASKNGGFVKGIDYINPAMKDVFEKIASELWREVSSK